MWKSGGDGSKSGSTGNNNNNRRKNVTSFYIPSTDIAMDIIGNNHNSTNSHSNSHHNHNNPLQEGTQTHQQEQGQHHPSQNSYAVVGGFDTGSILEQYLNPSTTATATATAVPTKDTRTSDAIISPSPNTMAFEAPTSTFTSALSMRSDDEEENHLEAGATTTTTATEDRDRLPEQGQLAYDTSPLVTSMDGLDVRESSVSSMNDQEQHGDVHVTETEAAVVGGFDTGSILEQYLNPSSTETLAATVTATVVTTKDTGTSDAIISPSPSTMAVEPPTFTSALSMSACDEEENNLEAGATTTATATEDDRLSEQGLALAYDTSPLVTNMMDGLVVRESSVSSTNDQEQHGEVHVTETEAETASHSDDCSIIHIRDTAPVNDVQPMEEDDSTSKDYDNDLYAIAHDDTCGLLSSGMLGDGDGDESDDNGIENQATPAAPVDDDDIPQCWSSPRQKTRIEAYLERQPDSESDNDNSSDSTSQSSDDDNEEYEDEEVGHAPLLDDDDDCCDFGDHNDVDVDAGHQSAWDEFINGSFTSTFPLHNEGEYVDLSQDDDDKENFSEQDHDPFLALPLQFSSLNDTGITSPNEDQNIGITIVQPPLDLLQDDDGVDKETTFSEQQNHDPFVAGDAFAAQPLQFSSLNDTDIIRQSEDDQNNGTIAIVQPTLGSSSNVNDSITATATAGSTSIRTFPLHKEGEYVDLSQDDDGDGDDKETTFSEQQDHDPFLAGDAFAASALQFSSSTDTDISQSGEDQNIGTTIVQPTLDLLQDDDGDDKETFSEQYHDPFLAGDAFVASALQFSSLNDTGMSQREDDQNIGDTIVQQPPLGSSNSNVNDSITTTAGSISINTFPLHDEGEYVDLSQDDGDDKGTTFSEQQDHDPFLARDAFAASALQFSSSTDTGSQCEDQNICTIVQPPLDLLQVDDGDDDKETTFSEQQDHDPFLAGDAFAASTLQFSSLNDTDISQSGEDHNIGDTIVQQPPLGTGSSNVNDSIKATAGSIRTNTFPLHKEGEYVDLSQDDDDGDGDDKETTFSAQQDHDPFLAGDAFAASALQFSSVNDTDISSQSEDQNIGTIAIAQPPLVLGSSNVNDSITATAGSIITSTSTNYNNEFEFASFGDFDDTSVVDHDHASLLLLSQKQSCDHVDVDVSQEMKSTLLVDASDSGGWVSFSAAAVAATNTSTTMPTVLVQNEMSGHGHGHESEDVAAAFHGSFEEKTTKTNNVSETAHPQQPQERQDDEPLVLVAAFSQQQEESENEVEGDPFGFASSFGEPDNTDTEDRKSKKLLLSPDSAADGAKKDSSLTKKSHTSTSSADNGGVGLTLFKSSFAAKMNAKLSQKQKQNNIAPLTTSTQDEPSASTSTSLPKAISLNDGTFVAAPPVPPRDSVTIYPSPSFTKESSTSKTELTRSVTVHPGIEANPSLQSPPAPRRRYHRHATTTTTNTTSAASASPTTMLVNHNKSLEDNIDHHDNNKNKAEAAASAAQESSAPPITVAELELELQVPQMEDATPSSQEEGKGKERKLPSPSPVRSRAKQMWQKQRQRANDNHNTAPTTSSSSTSNTANPNPANSTMSQTTTNNKRNHHLQQGSNENESISMTPVVEKYHFSLEAADNNSGTATLLATSSAEAASATTATTHIFTSSASPARAVVDDATAPAAQHLEALFKKNTLGTTKAAIAAELTARKFEGLYGRSNSHKNARNANARRGSGSDASSSAQNSPVRKNVSAPKVNEEEGEGDSSDPLSSVAEVIQEVAAAESFGEGGANNEQEQEIASAFSFSCVNLPQHLLPISHPALTMNISDNVERDKDGIRYWFHETVLRRTTKAAIALREDCNHNLQPDGMTLDVVNSLISFVSEQLHIRLYVDNSRWDSADAGGDNSDAAKRTPPKMSAWHLQSLDNSTNTDTDPFRHTTNKAPPRTPRVPSAGSRRGASFSQKSPSNNNNNKLAYCSPAGSRLSAATFTSAHSHATYITTGAHSLHAEWGSPMQPSSANRINDANHNTHAPEMANVTTTTSAATTAGDHGIIAGRNDNDLAVTRMDSMTSTSETTLLPYPMTSSSWNPVALVQSFLEWMVRISLHTRVPCPASVEALLLHVASLPTTSTSTEGDGDGYGVFQATLFASEDEYVVPILAFFQDACRHTSYGSSSEAQKNTVDKRCRGETLPSNQASNVVDEIVLSQSGSFDRRPLSPDRRRASVNNKARNQHLLLEIEVASSEQSNFIPPKYVTPPPPTSGPSAAEMVLIYKQPQLLLHILSYIGCPATLCRFKQVKSSFRRYIHRHQQRFFKEMVRVGGMSDEMRPKFWIWMTLVKCREAEDVCDDHDVDVFPGTGTGNAAGADGNGGVDDDYYLELPNSFVKANSDAANSHNSDRVCAWQSRQYSYDPEHPDHHGWEGINGVPNNGTDGGNEMPVAQWSHYNQSFTNSKRCGHAMTESPTDGGEGARHMMMMNGESVAAPAIGDDGALMMVPGQHNNPHPRDDFSLLEQIGREGKWQSVIARDVVRAFGTLPPHKTEGNRKRDSVVLALAKLRRGSSHGKNSNSSSGGGTPRSALSCISPSSGVADQSSQDESLRRILEHSELSGISRPPGDVDVNDDDGCQNEFNDGEEDELSSNDSMTIPDSELVLSGVHAQECKEEMQNQLSAILHALAAAYDEVGYCQVRREGKSHEVQNSYIYCSLVASYRLSIPLHFNFTFFLVGGGLSRVPFDANPG
jgi:hypothetical protein